MLDVSKEIFLLVRLINNEIEKQIANTLEPFGITCIQAQLVVKLYSYEEMTIGELAKSLQLTYPNCSLICQRLENAGLIEKVRSIKDRRVTKIRVTKKAIQIRDEVILKIKESYSHIFEKLGDENCLRLKDDLMGLYQVLTNK